MQTPKSITLHIGSYKTGSTAIQQFLKRNRQELKNNGWIYPHCACRNDNAHHLLPFALQQHRTAGAEDKSPEFVASIIDEANEAGVDNIILSSEVFFSLGEVQIQRLAALLEGHAVQVMSYLRRQDQFIHSFYMQCIKESNVRLSAPAEEYKGFSEIVDIMRYDQLIGWWADAFGSDAIILETFEKSRLSDGVMQSFCDLLNLDFLDMSKENKRSNETIETELIEYLRLINALDVSPAEHDALLKQLNVLSRTHGDFFTNNKYISPQTQGKVFSLYTNINESIREKYFSERDSLFGITEEDFTADANWNAPCVSNETIARISAWLWFAQSDAASVDLKKAA